LRDNLGGAFAPLFKRKGTESFILPHISKICQVFFQKIFNKNNPDILFILTIAAAMPF